MNKDFNSAQEVSVEIEGKIHAGRYIVERKVVTVTSGFGQKSTQLGGSNPEDIARLLLSELVRAHL